MSDLGDGAPAVVSVPLDLGKSSPNPNTTKMDAEENCL